MLRTWVEQENRFGWLLSAPAITILLFFVVYPFFVGIWLSLTNETVAAPGVFVGLQNYAEAFSSDIFRMTIRNTVVYVAVTLVLKLVLGMALALLMNQAIIGKRYIQATLLLPWIVPTALSSLAWKWLFDPTYSVFNWMLVHTGVAQALAPTPLGDALAMSPRGINWLGNGTWAMISLIIAHVWRGVPFFAISILAGLQTISEELYEAAAIDGASSRQRFRFVTVPLIKPVLLLVLLFSLIWTIADFQLIYVLTGGGPSNQTHLLSTLAYQIALRAGELGKGAAISLTMFPILLLAAIGMLWYMNRQDR